MKIAVTLLLAVALGGCATDGAAPTLYGQGIPVAPRPPAFSPTLDAPITAGQPGYIGSPDRIPPRGADKRVLPPTREPGIWASDPTQAAITPPMTKPVILEVELPVPDYILANRFRNGLDSCVEQVSGVFGYDYSLTASAGRLNKRELKCLVAVKFYECSRRTARAQASYYSRISQGVTNIADAKVMKNIKEQEDWAKTLHDDWCDPKKGGDTDRMRSVANEYDAVIPQRAKDK